ncbi:MAG TPA: efflux RND transporter periplasmic adaptor subunit [Terriglobales bacterium]|nr:efflux RND transporter periplasmic adaptor subunit [Terriglobales bacterium]
MNSRQWTVGAIAILALAASACSGGDEAKPPTPVVAVQVEAASRGPMQQWVTTQAVLFPLHQAVITPKISAPVAEFFVNRGDRVHAGETLARLENRDLAAADQEAQAQLHAAEAAYAQATAGAIPADLKKAQLDVTSAQQAAANADAIYRNRQRLYAQGAISQHDLEQAHVDATNADNTLALAQQHLTALNAGGHAQALRAAAADLATAQAHAAAAAAQLSYSEIRSPMDGVVTDRPAYPGELASPSAPLMTIMDLSHVVARAQLGAEQVAGLKVGDKATITLPGAAADKDQPTPAAVSVISAATDPGSTTLEVWVQAANPDQALRPGTTASVAILKRTIPEALTVPQSALLTDPSGGTSVMVVGTDNKAHEADVTAGVRADGRVQILSGLQAGQRVVTQGAYGLADGTQIKIEAPAPAAKPDGGDAKP